MSLELGIIPNCGIFRGLIRSSNTDDLGRTRTGGQTDVDAADARIDARRIGAAHEQRILPLPPAGDRRAKDVRHVGRHPPR